MVDLARICVNNKIIFIIDSSYVFFYKCNGMVATLQFHVELIFVFYKYVAVIANVYPIKYSAVWIPIKLQHE